MFQLLAARRQLLLVCCFLLLPVWSGFYPVFAESFGTEAPSEPAARQRPRLVLVLDASGSMQEDQRFARQVAGVAATLAILRDHEVAVVLFNHEAKTLVPLTPLTEAGRDRILDQTAAVPPEGGTDILAGVAAAL